MHLNYFDVIIADYSIPDIDGITLLKGVRARGYVGIFIIVTGSIVPILRLMHSITGQTTISRKAGKRCRISPSS
jgi:CheY-like chemotaxis protein